MYFSCGKYRLHRSAATRRLGKREIRALVALLVLCLFAVLLLSELVFDSKRPASHEPFLEADATLKSCYDHVRSIALSSGDKKRTLNISSPTSGSKHVKRDHEFLRRFGCLVDEGRELLEDGIVNAAGRYARPPQTFGDDAWRDNGWSGFIEHHDLPSVDDDDDDDVESPISSDDEHRPSFWDEVFRDVSGGVPPTREITRVRLSQDQLFSNDYGLIKPTNADYHGFYIPMSNFILMTVTFSPRWMAGRGGMPEDRLQGWIPRLNTLSDVVWNVWSRISPHPPSLRFYGLSQIANDVTGPLMDYLLERDRGSATVPWDDRLTYGLDSDEGKALLASPNGIAAAWLLIHRSGILGRRDPRVTIWEPGMIFSQRCMVWEFIPVGEHSTFDDYTAVDLSPPRSSKRHVLNSDPLSAILKGGHVQEGQGQPWSDLVAQWQRYWKQSVLPAFEGHSSSPTSQWTAKDLVGDDILNTGWTWKNEPEEDSSDHRKDASGIISQGNELGQNKGPTFTTLANPKSLSSTTASNNKPSQPASSPSIKPQTSSALTQNPVNITARSSAASLSKELETRIASSS
ncbi:MAG: hypothetical protein Q9226_008024 [Calogaya cf. arnoldii]